MTLPYRSLTHGPVAGRTVEVDFEGGAFGITERGAVVTGTISGGLFTPDATTGQPVYRVDRAQREIDAVAGMWGLPDMQREAFPVPYYCVTAAGSTTSAIKVDEPTLPNIAATANHILYILDKGAGPKRDSYLVDSVSGGDTINLVAPMSEAAPVAGVRVLLVAKRKPLPDDGDFPTPAVGFKSGAGAWFVLETQTGEIHGAALSGGVLVLKGSASSCDLPIGGISGDGNTTVTNKPRGNWDFGDAATIAGLPGGISATFDNSGTVLTDASWDQIVPFAWTLTGVRIIADEVTDLTVNILTTPFASFDPDGFAAIHATPPELTSDLSFEDTTLTGYATSFSALNIVRIAISGATAATRCAVLMDIVKG